MIAEGIRQPRRLERSDVAVARLRVRGGGAGSGGASTSLRGVERSVRTPQGSVICSAEF